MPATVVVGLQWGDEGKGKTTDLLAEPASRSSCATRAATTPATPSSSATRSSSCTSSRAACSIRTSRRSSATAWWSTRARCSTRWRCSTARGIDSSRVRVSRAAHVIMPYHVALDGAARGAPGRRRRSARRKRGIGPAYADRAWRVGAAHGRPARRGTGCALGSSARAARAQRDPRSETYGQPAFELETLVARAPSAGASGWRRPHHRHDDPASRTRSRRASTCCSRAPRARCSTSTTAPTPTSPAATRSRAAPAPAAASGRCQIDQVIGVLKAYSTRVGAGPLPTELRRRDRRAPAGEGPRVRDHDRPPRGAAAGSTPCRCATRSRSTASAASCSTSSTSCPGCPRSRLCVGYRVDGAPVDAGRCRSPSWSAPSRSTRRSRAGREDLDGVPNDGRPAAAPRSPTSTAIEELAGVPDHARQRRRRSGRRRSRVGSPAGGGRVTTRHAARDPGRGRGARRARHGLAAGRRARRRARDRGARQPADGGRRRAYGPDVRRSRRRRGSSRWPSRAQSTWSWSGPRLRSWPAWPTRCAVAGCRGPRAARPRRAPRGQQGRSRARWPTRRASRWPTGRRSRRSRRPSAFAAGARRQVVVKADGLAAGKGVTVCDDAGEPEAAIREALEEGRFGAAGSRVVVEERLGGPGGQRHRPVRRDGARWRCPRRATTSGWSTATDGPNTGGMGAYSPVAGPGRARPSSGSWRRIHAPVLAEVARRGTPFRGVLYAGLMLTAGGPRLLEFNVRLGDPEAQAVLPRLTVPLAPLLAAAAQGRLATAAAGLGLAPRAVLPAAPEARCGGRAGGGGLPRATAPRRRDQRPGRGRVRAGGLVFAAGVERTADGLHTAGGRVLTVVGRGRDLAAAADAAYDAAGHVTFAGAHLRRDIGRRRGRGSADDPALHAARDGRPVDRPGALRGDAAGRAGGCARAQARGPHPRRRPRGARGVGARRRGPHRRARAARPTTT